MALTTHFGLLDRSGKDRPGRGGGQVVKIKVKDELKVATRAIGYGVAERMHCECAIVAHLHQYNTFPAFSYIRRCVEALLQTLQLLDPNFQPNYGYATQYKR